MAVAWIDDQSSEIPTTSQTHLRPTAQTPGRVPADCGAGGGGGDLVRTVDWASILRRPNSDWNLIRYFMWFLCLKPSAGSSLASIEDWMCGN
ncbi:Os11g0689000 [Oryza sativa Japonica Group]|uniref:Os11g0689000 protein n=1 Tax=Oryza sativa subsp. japonica TaxID=39947 RepID=Q0IR14_ORYSJ|nr:Os11g0689000 [Oryza sativa Japonica Group]|eukprot:NP_001068488.1 Os11g0689000 [Oryza sativa Japonica Group]